MWFVKRWSMVLVGVGLLLCLGGCDEDEPQGDDDDDDDSAAPIPQLSATVEANPFNPFSALVHLTANVDCEAVARYGEGGAFDRQTPSRTAEAGVDAEIVVLGLHADREYGIRVDATCGDTELQSEEMTFTTAALPEGFPGSEVLSTVDSTSFSSTEVICTNGVIYNGSELPIYYCIDREGEPVFSLTHPEEMALWQVAPLSGGTWAAVSASSSEISFYDRKGEQTAAYTDLWFVGLTRFEHEWIDLHEIVEITEGPWTGAIVFLTMSQEWVDVDGVEEVKPGGGIIVFNPLTEEVLWDWSAHGDLGDDVPIDPSFDYYREVLLYDVSDWLVANACLHGVDDDGGQFFWLSLRGQDWIIKVDVDTDEVVWRMGYEGDFALVNDLDAADPIPLNEDLWMYHQHAPEWQERSGSRTRFLVFDNGTIRASAAGDPDWDHRYSRVVEFEIDEQTMKATIAFEYGAPVVGADAYFYSEGGGDADMIGGAQNFFYVAGWEPGCHIADISYPAGEHRWRMVPDECNQYRVNVFPSIYETVQ